jgi:hypothetical protein
MMMIKACDDNDDDCECVMIWWACGMRGGVVVVMMH